MLDLGCGDGVLISRLWNQVKVLGLEVDGVALRLAQSEFNERGIPVRLVQGNATQLPLPDGSVDLVTATELLEHLSRPEEMLTEVTRVLHRAGTFFCTTPLRPSGVDEEAVRDPFHVREYSPSELQEFLQEFFLSVEIRAVVPKILLSLYRGPFKFRAIDLGIRAGINLVSHVVNPFERIVTKRPRDGWDELIAICQSPRVGVPTKQSSDPGPD